MVPHSSKFPSMSESHHSALGASRVLLVDDDRLSLKVAQMALEKAGMEVDSFTNPEEALAYFEEHPMGYYTCLLTDYSMPEMTGVELLAALRQRDEFLSCIVITARDEQDIVRDSYRRGALDMLGKPVDLRELLRVMRLACKKTALTRKEAETVAGVEEAGRNERVITMPMPQSWKGDSVFITDHVTQSVVIFTFVRSRMPRGIVCSWVMCQDTLQNPPCYLRIFRVLSRGRVFRRATLSMVCRLLIVCSIGAMTRPRATVIPFLSANSPFRTMVAQWSILIAVLKLRSRCSGVERCVSGKKARSHWAGLTS